MRWGADLWVLRPGYIWTARESLRVRSCVHEYAFADRRWNGMDALQPLYSPAIAHTFKQRIKRLGATHLDNKRAFQMVGLILGHRRTKRA